jgi:hypothetical protein
MGKQPYGPRRRLGTTAEQRRVIMAEVTAGKIQAAVVRRTERLVAEVTEHAPEFTPEQRQQVAAAVAREGDGG